MRGHAVNSASEDVQQRGYPLGSNMVLVSNVLGQRAGNHDGNRIVNQSKVQQTGHSGNAIFSAFTGVDPLAHGSDEPIHTAVFTDDANETPEENSNDSGRHHTGHTGADGLNEAGNGHAAGNDAHNAGNERAAEEAPTY